MIGKLFKEFEKKFGFECYESIKEILGKQHMKIEELTKSREKWKEKYFKLKNETITIK